MIVNRYTDHQPCFAQSDSCLYITLAWFAKTTGMIVYNNNTCCIRPYGFTKTSRGCSEVDVTPPRKLTASELIGCDNRSSKYGLLPQPGNAVHFLYTKQLLPDCSNPSLVLTFHCQAAYLALMLLNCRVLTGPMPGQAIILLASNNKSM